MKRFLELYADYMHKKAESDSAHSKLFHELNVNLQELVHSGVVKVEINHAVLRRMIEDEARRR